MSWPTMTRTNFVRAYRALGAGLIVGAAIDTLILRWDKPDFSLGNFFSYFTVLSNLCAAAVLLVGATKVGRATSTRWEMVRGAAVLYMAITGIVYLVALQGVDSVADSTPQFANWVMHRIMPLAMVADWLYQLPQVPLTFRRNLVWLVLPLLYLPYTLIRGSIVDWYPYPFVDPTRDGGYWRVAGSCLIVAASFVAMAWLITWVGNALREREPRSVGRAASPAGLP